jgi:hypothetical protein
MRHNRTRRGRSVFALAEQMRERLERSDVSRSEAEQLLGFIILESVAPGVDSHPRTRRRRWRALRRLGLVLGPLDRPT